MGVVVGLDKTILGAIGVGDAVGLGFAGGEVFLIQCMLFLLDLILLISKLG